MKIVAFTGKSNSGKTTLIEKIIKVLHPSYCVAAIKHDPKNKAQIDTEGKDSYKFFQAGADVVIASANKTTMMFQDALDMEFLYKMFYKKDYVFIEGLKELELPRICVVRDEIDEKYIPYSDAFALDMSVKNISILPSGVCVLDVNNPKEIIEWIDKNARKING
ncbi:molybdopterin-guanine dinucleotide biosynthesis protein B [Helicobacter cappadocius]|uniref:Molybdopterin-guanine dinucleotide biosynthesis protein B n=1 Tax=Helicobacter cappadocius TaxID=3063998 RepID=A0AA90TA25_9HELI|nr:MULTISPECIES: molybdopterin-guanine dinucleotide biosynthesis protein B [unclassified Helicobacter]MDO7253554.1 molybdopterin-guanine dinucleotide biosynthesis protein B [Helicobacter sp. faydin-H75]MDP2539482.1 molybdopterin-guanine dinucleotide biosynthesis protein B [Helicobacter sp. faydin-H76]